MEDSLARRESFSCLTRFLHANRDPPSDQVRGHASLENANAIEGFFACRYADRITLQCNSAWRISSASGTSSDVTSAFRLMANAARLKNVGHLYRATGLSPEEADAQAFLFYCFSFGQSLLFLQRGPRKRAQLVAKSAEKLIEDENGA